MRSTAPQLCLKQAALSGMALQPAANRRSCFECSVAYSAHLRLAQRSLLIERPLLDAWPPAPPDRPVAACVRSRAPGSDFCVSHQCSGLAAARAYECMAGRRVAASAQRPVAVGSRTAGSGAALPASGLAAGVHRMARACPAVLRPRQLWGRSCQSNGCLCHGSPRCCRDSSCYKQRTETVRQCR